ncbi:hypothetical protein BT96DRAFT_291908 [Gymnopus androsaceus JB14]|uniref:Uncharacterized protein n=1 Tax=Gymnopus androsaceus JB14 TaxID=1447944 RepID=A0A6A4H3E7_9AGAR|nr:hypothetical protein BT96DRAFT_291908 [Gymnopus androsaceus JB14]
MSPEGYSASVISPGANETLALRTRLAEEESRRLAMKVELDRMKSAYVAQCEIIAKIRNSLTAIHQLPSEILSLIFGAYIEDNRDIPFSQLLLTQICATWRECALNNAPRIWTSLYISVDKCSFADHPSMIRDWFNRSSLPLEIRVETAGQSKFGKSGKAVVDFLVQVAETLAPFCSRIRALKLEGPLRGFMPLFTLPVNSLPILTELDLNLRIDSKTKWPKNQMIYSFSESSLRNLKFRCSFPGHDDWLPQSPFPGLLTLTFDSAQLISLDLEEYGGSDPGRSWNLLDGYRNLVECTLTIGEESEEAHSNALVPVTLLALTTLTLKSPDEAKLRRFNVFVLLTTPSLTHLYLEFSPSELGPSRGVNFARVLIDFQQRVRFPLTSLSLMRADMITSKEISSIVDTFSNLRSFTFIGDKMRPKSLLQKLICRTNNEPCVPRLESLRISWPRFENLSPSMLLDVVESRWSGESTTRLMQVQMDKVIQLSEDSSEESDHNWDHVSDELELAWLEGRSNFPWAKMSVDEEKRLQHLEAEGFKLLSSTLPIMR